MKPKLALLIDAENVNCNEIKFAISKANKYGDLIIKRAYGNFTNIKLTCWQAVVQKFAISIAKKFPYKKGKNSTDIELIIDATELRFSKKIDGIVLLACDSDYIGLATRYREDNLIFIVIGKANSSEILKTAGTHFIEIPKFVETVNAQNIYKINAPILPKLVVIGKVELEQQNKNTTPILPKITNAINATCDSNGLSYLGDVGTFLNKKEGINCKTQFNCSLLQVVKSNSNLFEIHLRNKSSFYITNKAI
jgi:NYN domain